MQDNTSDHYPLEMEEGCQKKRVITLILHVLRRATQQKKPENHYSQTRHAFTEEHHNKQKPEEGENNHVYHGLDMSGKNVMHILIKK